jgi:hypothetical protein
MLAQKAENNRQQSEIENLRKLIFKQMQKEDQLVLDNKQLKEDKTGYDTKVLGL